MIDETRDGPSSQYDPTPNVLLLVEAANKRQDDLRELNNQLFDCKAECLEKISNIREQHVEHLRNQETRWSDKMERRSREIRESESNRLNAIRQVDVLAVNTAADRAAVAIAALAATNKQDAENLRNALTTTATTIATQTDNTVKAMTDRIAALEKSSYEGKGKGEGIGASWSVLLAVGTVIISLITVFFVLRAPTPPAVQAPQVYYVPAPPGALLPSTPPQQAPR